MNLEESEPHWKNGLPTTSPIWKQNIFWKNDQWSFNHHIVMQGEESWHDSSICHKINAKKTNRWRVVPRLLYLNDDHVSTCIQLKRPYNQSTNWMPQSCAKCGVSDCHFQVATKYNLTGLAQTLAEKGVVTRLLDWTPFHWNKAVTWWPGAMTAMHMKLLKRKQFKWRSRVTTPWWDNLNTK